MKRNPSKPRAFTLVEVTRALRIISFALLAMIGLWQKFNDALRDKVRAKHGKKPRLRASSTLRRLKWLTNPESAVAMLARRW
jgi:type II secretory pathway pseudopilin PulG